MSNSSIPRPECALATSILTQEGKELGRRIEADLDIELDQYELTTPICREKACPLSLDDYLRLLGAAASRVDSEIESETRTVSEWVPADCPIRSGEWPPFQPDNQ